nr:2-succinyl-5-enolpyruvyl-6-hydroxy-3-cyclohexene-1-carboxylic-acid synthase [Acidobacteriota bacterium]
MQTADVTATFCATLVDEWCAAGVRHAVVAPGSRSTPMALALSDHTDVSIEVFHDERSAGFCALGIAKATGRPTLLLCTSGTATANFHPAVMEANHAEIPLIVLTADRPPELQGVGAPQTTDQQRLYGSSVRWFVDAGVPDDVESGGWRRLARRIFAAATGGRPGPVHLNLPFREPLVGRAGVLPPGSQSSTNAQPTGTLGTNGSGGTRINDSRIGTESLSNLNTRMSGKRGVIVAGARGGTPTCIMGLASKVGWPVLADPLGGCRGDDPLAVRHADGWLRDADLARKFAPEVILRFGALPASKVVNAWIRDCAAEVLAIGESPFLIDPDRRVTTHLVTNPDHVCTDVSNIAKPAPGDWTTLWRDAERTARDTVETVLADSVLDDGSSPLSEPHVARLVVDTLQSGANLVVSSSMPIRDVEWFGGRTDHARVFSNRGLNGIDGVVSTAVGVALATGRPTTLLIGDVAFLHDTNALIDLRGRGVDLRIVVVDNRGGGIFSFLPQRTTLETSRFEKLFGTPHAAQLGALAGAHGIPNRTVTTPRALRESLATSGPHVTVVETERTRNVDDHDSLNQAIIAAVARSVG